MEQQQWPKPARGTPNRHKTFLRFSRERSGKTKEIMEELKRNLYELSTEFFSELKFHEWISRSSYEHQSIPSKLPLIFGYGVFSSYGLGIANRTHRSN